MVKAVLAMNLGRAKTPAPVQASQNNCNVHTKAHNVS